MVKKKGQTPWERCQDKFIHGGIFDCWEWTASKSNGYGKIVYQGKHLQAHRIAYEANFGPIPDGLEIDHLCLNKACVNPTHLEAVPHVENVNRYWRLTTRAHLDTKRYSVDNV